MTQFADYLEKEIARLVFAKNNICLKRDTNNSTVLRRVQLPSAVTDNTAMQSDTIQIVFIIMILLLLEGLWRHLTTSELLEGTFDCNYSSFHFSKRFWFYGSFV